MADTKDLTTDNLSTLKEAFLLIDTKDVGFITSRDLCMCLRSLGYNPTEAECQDLINKVHPEGDGRLHFDEFVTMMCGKEKNEEYDELKEVFHVFDCTGNGYVGPSELKRVMENLGEHISHEEANELVRSVNPVSSSIDVLDYERFVMLLSS